MKTKGMVLVGFAFFWLFAAAACKNNPEGPDGQTKNEFKGQITLNGVPLANVDVYLSFGASRKTTTGADGKFGFTDLPSGTFIITPSMPGYAFSPSNYELSQPNSGLNFTASPAVYGTELNFIAVNFTALDQNRQTVSLSDFHGKVILIDFTADWCVPCREKAETAESFYQTYKDRGFMYILIVIEGSASTWASTYGLTFPVLDDNSRAIYNLYRKTSIPLPHVLDRNCTIRYKTEGWNKSEVEDVIKKYL